MKVKWDENKSASNLVKHKVSFTEAQTVFDDPLAATVSDPDHSFDEKRFVTVGETFAGRLIVVSHTLELKIIRIISARKPRRKRVMRIDEMRDEYDFSDAKRGVVYGKVKKNEISASKEIAAQIERLAVCIKTFDSKSLIIREIYNVTFLANNLVAVIDEKGENEIYPAELFLPLSLSSEIENALALIAA